MTNVYNIQNPYPEKIIEVVQNSYQINITKKLLTKNKLLYDIILIVYLSILYTIYISISGYLGAYGLEPPLILLDFIQNFNDLFGIILEPKFDSYPTVVYEMIANLLRFILIFFLVIGDSIVHLGWVLVFYHLLFTFFNKIYISANQQEILVCDGPIPPNINRQFRVSKLKRLCTKKVTIGEEDSQRTYIKLSAKAHTGAEKKLLKFENNLEGRREAWFIKKTLETYLNHVKPMP